jgi:hypothetical protein
LAERFFTAASVILSANRPLANTLRALAVMGKNGSLDIRIAHLMSVKGLGITRAKLAVEAGITTVGQLIDAEPAMLSRAIKVSPRMARQIQHNARVASA